MRRWLPLTIVGLTIAAGLTWWSDRGARRRVAALRRYDEALARAGRVARGDR